MIELRSRRLMLSITCRVHITRLRMDLLSRNCHSLMDGSHFFLAVVHLGDLGLDEGILGALRRWEEKSDLVNLCKLVHPLRDAEHDARLSQLEAQQIEDHQCQDTVEGVYAQLLVGPVEGGTEAEVARIF
jgi:hypothetical protein